MSFVVLGMGGGGSSVSALRLLRLLRLVSALQNSEELRVIIGGLVGGMKSVFYILLLLVLVMCKHRTSFPRGPSGPLFYQLPLSHAGAVSAH